MLKTLTKKAALEEIPPLQMSTTEEEFEAVIPVRQHQGQYLVAVFYFLSALVGVLIGLLLLTEFPLDRMGLMERYIFSVFGLFYVFGLVKNLVKGIWQIYGNYVLSVKAGKLHYAKELFGLRRTKRFKLSKIKKFGIRKVDKEQKQLARALFRSNVTQVIGFKYGLLYKKLFHLKKYNAKILLDKIDGYIPVERPVVAEEEVLVLPASAPERSTIKRDFDGLHISIPAKRKWWLVGGNIVFLAGWLFFEKFAFDILLSSGGVWIIGLFMVFITTLIGATGIYSLIWQLSGEEQIHLKKGQLVQTNRTAFWKRQKTYDLDRIKNLKLAPEEIGQKIDPHPAIGGKIQFEYEGRLVHFCAQVSDEEAAHILEKLKNSDLM